jgi:hypothetical protein
MGGGSPGTPAAANTDVCEGEGSCMVRLTTFNMLYGHQYQRTVFDDFRGGTACNMFRCGSSGVGSLNIPTAARTGLYVLDGDKNWFLDYFDAQDRPDVGFMGREFFSTVYAAGVVDSVVRVKSKAQQLGHTDIVSDSNRWLRAYWAFSSLGALDVSVRTAVFHKAQIDYTKTLSLGQTNFNGYAVSLAGPRASKQTSNGMGGESGPGSPNHILLSWALGNTRVRTPGGPIAKTTLGLLGHSIGVQFRSDDSMVPISGSLPPEKFGLSQTERNQLKTFIETNGSQNLVQVLGMTAGYRAPCSYHIYRSTQGVISWMEETCNANKGPYSISKTTSDGRSEWMLMTTDNQGAEPTRTERFGNQICTTNLELNITKCMTLPGGPKIYEIEWLKGQTPTLK